MAQSHPLGSCCNTRMDQIDHCESLSSFGSVAMGSLITRLALTALRPRQNKASSEISSSYPVVKINPGPDQHFIRGSETFKQLPVASDWPEIRLRPSDWSSGLIHRLLSPKAAQNCPSQIGQTVNILYEVAASTSRAWSAEHVESHESISDNWTQPPGPGGEDGQMSDGSDRSWQQPVMSEWRQSFPLFPVTTWESESPTRKWGLGRALTGSSWCL